MNKLRDFYYNLKNMITNFFSWGLAMRNEVSYDYSGLYLAINHKLTVLQKLMLNGYGDYSENPKILKSLRIAIKLSAKLSGERYSIRAYDRAVKKYGEIVSPLHDIIEGKEYHESFVYYMEEAKKTDISMKRDHKILFNIISNYLWYWWD